MIISRLMGGLGNQMFQYAAGRRLAHEHKTELKLDINDYQKDQFRRYGLDCFKIKAEFASPIEVFRFYPTEGLLQLARQYSGKKGERLLELFYHFTGVHCNLLRRYYSYNPNDQHQPLLLQGRIAPQRHFHYDKEFLKCPDNIYITGFWISQKYFIEIENIIRDEFTFNKPLSCENQEIAEFIQESNSVSIHVRRTDKVYDPLYEETNLSYCIKAMQYINDYVEKPHYFVFSDDISWVKMNLQYSGDVTFVDINDDLHNYNDLRLMSLCDHNIIAESSFSWWGAWLNSNPEKLVISPNPRRWIKLENFIVDDILPPEWIILE